MKEIDWDAIDNSWTIPQALAWLSEQCQNHSQEGFEVTLDEMVAQFHWSKHKVIKLLKRNGVPIDGEHVVLR